MFLGATRSETTTYVHEGGLLVSSTTVREPEWTDQDRGWVLALLAEKADTCPGCGHPVSECRDPATRGQWSYEATVCQACVIAQAVSDNAAEAKTRGLYVGTYRNVPGEGSRG